MKISESTEPVLAFTFGTSLITGILFGLAPGWRAIQENLTASLKAGGRRGQGDTGLSLSRHRLRGLLVLSELAFADAADRSRHDVGLRVALGARPRDIVGVVVRRGMTLTGAGIIAGLLGAAVLTRWMSSLLFGYAPRMRSLSSRWLHSWLEQPCWRS